MVAETPAPEEAIREEHWLERANRELCEQLGAGKCVFCAGPPRISGGGMHYWCVTCKICGARSGLSRTGAQAIAAWNRRAASEREYTREEMREACQNNYNAGRAAASEREQQLEAGYAVVPEEPTQAMTTAADWAYWNTQATDSFETYRIIYRAMVRAAMARTEGE